LNFLTPSYAETAEPAAPTGEAVEGTEAHGGGHHTFPPFDPATFGSQIFWLIVCFGALYFLMSRVAVPRLGAILYDRNDRIGRDLADAGGAHADAGDAGTEQSREFLGGDWIHDEAPLKGEG
jgi:F-type H+-transporting ATPase subunit b